MNFSENIKNLIDKRRKSGILALDLANKTGFAYRGVDGKIKHGTWLLREKDESDGIRLMRLADHIKSVHATVGIGFIPYEKASGRNALAVIRHAELQSVIKLLAGELGYEYKGYSATSIKKQAGKGTLGKPEMIKRAERKFGVKGLTDDEADALWLLDLARSEFSL